MNSHTLSTQQLEKYGIKNAPDIIYNPSYETFLVMKPYMMKKPQIT